MKTLSDPHLERMDLKLREGARGVDGRCTVVSHVAFNIDRVYNMWPCHVTYSYIEHLINLLITQVRSLAKM